MNEEKCLGGMTEKRGVVVRVKRAQDESEQGERWMNKLKRMRNERNEKLR